MEKILELLKKVKDPELGENIVDLGLVYEVKVEGKRVFVKLGVTSPFCPLAGVIAAKVEEVLRTADYEPEVVLDLNTPWTPDRMSPELRRKYGLGNI